MSLPYVHRETSVIGGEETPGSRLRGIMRATASDSTALGDAARQRLSQRKLTRQPSSRSTATDGETAPERSSRRKASQRLPSSRRKPSLSRQRSSTIVVAGSDSPPRDDREALTRFYRRCSPDKLSHVEKILAKFAGDRDAMYATVEALFPGERVERPSP